ncbi:MAG: hypothetical protein MUP55_03875 [Candidatus Aenigmarchaeota archaeon]|nr:hypothetical protein [Candidatus Aenigmarchaeota archaeon]
MMWVRGVLHLLKDIDSTRSEIGEFEHIKNDHPDVWKTWYEDGGDPEEYLDEQHYQLKLHMEKFYEVMRELESKCR